MGKALIIKGANFSQVAVDTIDIAVGQPTISIDLFGNVTIASPNGEDIYYTTDGTTPTTASTKYTVGFVVQMNTTVKAVCYLGGNYSEVVSELYDGTLQAPIINITNRGVVTITATNNASIRYTVDGQTDPTTSTGTEYSAPFTVEDGVEVRAIAYITQGGTTISSTVSTATATVAEGMSLNKKLNFTSSLNEVDAEGYCVSPYFNIFNGADSVAASLIKIIWWYGAGAGSANNINFVTTSDKETCKDYWGNQTSTDRILTGSSTTYSKLTRYCKATFPMGHEGYVEIYHRPTVNDEYVLVAKYVYNGGETDETATWTKTYDINNEE